MYEGKPHQLAAVLKNAKKLYCPIRETYLYANPTYVSRSSGETSMSKTEKRQIEQEQNKKPKKQKKLKSDGDDTLSKSELGKLTKIRLEIAKIVYATRTPSRPTITISSFQKNTPVLARRWPPICWSSKKYASRCNCKRMSTIQ